ncbi:enoyl-CoA hydratase-related protein [Jatrophihabitans telluris]|uniref:Enoyl-CoA hydratase-related protein n=1 Tax=Jatrophihabitans telluris TaxID=2038343 RepID=A0ABY4R0W7_9ACTN|nr:enoyl-CoA hydratase-related protein [Jatrophihabitans telluris]UQX88977.1 enoyl-CoA hydratase-related protein [Jatrophihabitans telluris]
MAPADDYETITCSEDGPLFTITMNRPEHGNMFNTTMLREIHAALESNRRETRTRVVVITGAGDRFFCIGGEKTDLEDSFGYPGFIPVVDVYAQIERHPKPVIAAVNGYAVGGGHVLHVVCDLTIAKESAVFRQVGPAMGSYDAGYGTWCLEDLVGRKRAKEIWFLNEKITASSALAMGLVNKVVPDATFAEEVRAYALAVADRGSHALRAVKASFAVRTGGVEAVSRIATEMLMPFYMRTAESAELGASFREKRAPDTTTFNH